MNMIANFMGNLMDKEKATIDTIKMAMQEVAEETGLNHREFGFFIQPKTKDFDFKIYIVKINPTTGAIGAIVREITVKEIVGEAEE